MANYEADRRTDLANSRLEKYVTLRDCLHTAQTLGNELANSASMMPRSKPSISARLCLTTSFDTFVYEQHHGRHAVHMPNPQSQCLTEIDGPHLPILSPGVPQFYLPNLDSSIISSQLT